MRVEQGTDEGLHVQGPTDEDARRDHARHVPRTPERPAEREEPQTPEKSRRLGEARVRVRCQRDLRLQLLAAERRRSPHTVEQREEIRFARDGRERQRHAHGEQYQRESGGDLAERAQQTVQQHGGQQLHGVTDGAEQDHDLERASAGLETGERRHIAAEHCLARVVPGPGRRKHQQVQNSGEPREAVGVVFTEETEQELFSFAATEHEAHEPRAPLRDQPPGTRACTTTACHRPPSTNA